jgi:oligogalacturonide lyase
MKLMVSAILTLFLAGLVVAQTELPREWIDKDTCHRIRRLSDIDGSQSFYFHQNGYTRGGDKMVFSTPAGLSVFDFKTWKSKPLVDGRCSSVIVGPRTRQVFYTKDDGVFATNIDTGVTRLIVRRADLRGGSGWAVNADETLLGGSRLVNPAPPDPGPRETRDSYASKGEMMERRLAARLPMVLFTINIATGEVKDFYHATDWLNHVQFSPTDPTLMMFCHEGPWHKVDRIWTIRTDGTGLKLMHQRTMPMEIAGHEFFGGDGKHIWYDLQTPKSEVFWLAGVEIASGKQVRYPVPRSEWSVHFNVSPDGKLFAGDGGGPNSVAAPGNGQWIYLFRPKVGKLGAEKLVNLARHNYELEPNVTFTPDQKWLVFRSNFLGPTHVFAVELRPTANSARR